MSVYPTVETAPPPAPRRRPGWLVPAIIGGAVAVVLLVAAVGALFWTLGQRDAQAPAAGAPSAAATFPVRGSLQLDAPRGLAVGDECNGSGGYRDIRSGAQVTVTDGTGAVLALGQLTMGVVSSHPVISGGKVCAFSFTVDSVPTGKGIYGIEVSHRGVVRFEEAALMAGDATLSLG